MWITIIMTTIFAGACIFMIEYGAKMIKAKDQGGMFLIWTGIIFLLLISITLIKITIWR